MKGLQLPGRPSGFMDSLAQTKPKNLCCCFFLSAIYNYNPRGDQELRLQVGDAVHILEKLEGK